MDETPFDFDALDLARERAAFEARMGASRPGLSLACSQDGSYWDAQAQALWDGWSERADASRRFPVKDGPSIPWRAIEPCERLARAHLGQGLDQLARAGGLDPFEALDLIRARAPGHHRAILSGSLESASEELRRAVALVDGPVVPPGYALVATEPSEALLMSMALRLDHGLAAPGLDEAMERMIASMPADRRPTPEAARGRRVEVALNDMRKVHEEMVGKGFHNPKDESLHKGLLAQARRSSP